MCGIIAVLGRPGARPVPAPADVLDPLAAAARELDGPPGVRALLASPALADDVGWRVAELEAAVGRIEADLDGGRLDIVDPAAVERLNAALVRLRDLTWAVRSDRLRTARGVADLGGPAAVDGADGWWAIQVALSALDRLE